MMRFLLILGLALLTGCAIVPPPPTTAGRFQFPDSTFAFANETVFNYRDGSRVPEDRPASTEVHRYSRRCFVMAAAAVQFWKHARFDPNAPPVSEAELGRRVREVVDRAAWDPVPSDDQRVVFPGFASLHDFSDREGAVLRANLGAAWTGYFQPRKFCMIMGPSKAEEAAFNAQLSTWIDRGHPIVLWMYNFPSLDMDHAVVAFARRADGDKIAYTVYDSNYTDQPRTLEYDPATQTFSYEATFYFKGGPVHVRPVYLSLWH